MSLGQGHRDYYFELLGRLAKLDQKLTRLGAQALPAEHPKPQQVTAVVSAISTFNSATIEHARREIARLRGRLSSLPASSGDAGAIKAELAKANDYVERQAAKLRPV